MFSNTTHTLIFEPCNKEIRFFNVENPSLSFINCILMKSPPDIKRHVKCNENKFCVWWLRTSWNVIGFSCRFLSACGDPLFWNVSGFMRCYSYSVTGLLLVLFFWLSGYGSESIDVLRYEIYILPRMKRWRRNISFPYSVSHITCHFCCRRGVYVGFRVTMSSEPETKHKEHSSGTIRKKHRSRSTPRYNDVDKPRKKRHISAGTSSLVSIPNTIKLTMLNTGLLPTSIFNNGKFQFIIPE